MIVPSKFGIGNGCRIDAQIFTEYIGQAKRTLKTVGVVRRKMGFRPFWGKKLSNRGKYTVSDSTF